MNSRKRQKIWGEGKTIREALKLARLRLFPTVTTDIGCDQPRRDIVAATSTTYPKILGEWPVPDCLTKYNDPEFGRHRKPKGVGCRCKLNPITRTAAQFQVPFSYGGKNTPSGLQHKKRNKRNLCNIFQRFFWILSRVKIVIHRVANHAFTFLPTKGYHRGEVGTFLQLRGGNMLDLQDLPRLILVGLHYHVECPSRPKILSSRQKARRWIVPTVRSPSKRSTFHSSFSAGKFVNTNPMYRATSGRPVNVIGVLPNPGMVTFPFAKSNPKTLWSIETRVSAPMVQAKVKRDLRAEEDVRERPSVQDCIR